MNDKNLGLVLVIVAMTIVLAGLVLSAANKALTAECLYVDGDGFSIDGGLCGLVDCDDADSAVYPGAVETPSADADKNCDGRIPRPPVVECTDVDGDGYSIDGGTCGLIDCNDVDPSVHPGAISTLGDSNNCGIAYAQSPE